MDDDVKKMLEDLEKLIDDAPLPKDLLKVLRNLIEFRTVIEIAEAFNVRRDEIAFNLRRDIEIMEREFPWQIE